MNKAILIGRLVKDPELAYTPSGVAVAKFTIAVDRRFKNAAGEKEADFINCVAWRKSAEFASNYLSKGRLVAVEGSLQVSSWEKDGQRQYKTEVVVDNLQGLDKPRDGGQQVAPQQPDTGGVVEDDSYDPFASEE